MNPNFPNRECLPFSEYMREGCLFVGRVLVGAAAGAVGGLFYGGKMAMDQYKQEVTIRNYQLQALEDFVNDPAQHMNP